MIQVLTTDANARMSAARAAEHAWLGGPSKASSRRRAVRVEAAAITVERAVAAAEIAKARFALSSSAAFAAAAPAVATSQTAAAVTEATAAELSGMVELAATMSRAARAIQEEVKRLEKRAATVEATGKSVATAGGAGGGAEALAEARAEAVAVRLKAEGKVCQAEVLAEQAEQSCEFADAAVSSWEKAIAAVARGDSGQYF